VNSRHALQRCAIASAAIALGLAGGAWGATNINLTLYPNYAGLQGTLPLGINSENAPGFSSGCWRANVTGVPLFTSIILLPNDLFARTDVKVNELKSVSYYTKKAGAQGSVDWFFQFYTKPYSGSPGASWYGHRINSEPYFSDDLNAPANDWNKWQTDASVDNRLRFYDSSNNYFGGYTDPFLADLATLTYPIPAWNLNLPYPPLGPQEIDFFNLGLGTAWSNGFQGRIDGIRIELTDGSVATINLEDFPPPAVALESDSDCYTSVGDTVTVNVKLTGDGINTIAGGQFFLSYDTSKLAFLSAVPGSPVAGPGLFSWEVYEFAFPGLLDYAVGIQPPNAGTNGNATMAVLTFEALDEVCDAASLVEFRPNVPPTRLTTPLAAPVYPDLTDLNAISIDATAPNFTFIPANTTVECDDSTDPSDTGQATASDACGTPVVTYSDVNAPGACPQAYTITRTWKATDECGNEATANQTINVVDTTAPVLVGVPGNVVVDAFAGTCSATVTLEGKSLFTFNSNPVLSSTQAPGVWYTDRYPPFGFASAFFDGGNRLKHSINASDCETCRPGGYNSAFYNTQGRKFDTPGATSMSIELYVPSDWATTNRRMAGFWATAFDSGNAVSFFPIVEFTSDGGTPRFRAWNGTGWNDLGLPSGFSYDAWQTLEFSLVGSNVVYKVGDLTLSLNSGGSVSLGNVILQGHNTVAGVTYDIYWDDLSVVASIPSAIDACDPSPVVTWVRSDSAPNLNAPYASGVTTITWTATDACGNFSTAQTTVTVNAVNVMLVDISLQATVSAGPFTRCIVFELTDANGYVVATVPATLTFVNGTALAAVDVPCGLYGGCLAARDPLHTLRSTGNLSILGNEYVADGFLPLRGGDMNDDTLIDILDFGVYVWQYGVNYGTGNTNCSTPYPHADVNGDGLVDLADLTFVSTNFLKVDQVCPTMLPAMAGKNPGMIRPATPRTRVSVRELRREGLGHLAVADLNGDGMVDATDVAQFLVEGHP